MSYRALKRRFDLDDDYLEDLKEEIIYAKQLAMDKDGRVPIWVGETRATPGTPATQTAQPEVIGQDPSTRTKAILATGVLKEADGHYELKGSLSALGIPMTLHDSHTARLDRLETAKGIAQLGATIGRQFSFDLLLAVSSLNEQTLRRGLDELVEAELLYQRGRDLKDARALLDEFA